MSYSLSSGRLITVPLFLCSFASHLDIRHLNRRSTKGRRASQSNADVPHVRQRIAIRMLDHIQILCRHRAFQIGRSNMQHEVRVQVRHLLSQRRSESVQVDVLSDRHEYRSRKSLEEGDNGGPDADVLFREDSGGAHKREVPREADAETVDELISHLGCCASVHAPSRH